MCWGKWKMKWSLCWFQRSLHHWPQRNLASNHHEWPTSRSLGGRDSTIGPGLPVHRHPRRGLPCRLETWKWHCMCIVIYTCSIHIYNEYLKLFNVRVFIINNVLYMYYIQFLKCSILFDYKYWIFFENWKSV